MFSFDQALFRLRWIPFRGHCCLAPKKCLLEFTRFSDIGLRFQSFCPCLNFDDRARESRGDGTSRLGGVDEFNDHPKIP